MKFEITGDINETVEGFNKLLAITKDLISLEYTLNPSKLNSLKRYFMEAKTLDLYTIEDSVLLPSITVKRVKEAHPIAGKWYQCELRQGVLCRDTLLYCLSNGVFDLPIEVGAFSKICKWKQEDVTITGLVSVTPI